MANLAVIVVVIILGALAFVLGLVGVFTGIKSSDLGTVSLDEKCHFPTKPAAAFGIISSLLILAAQITANVAGGCVCCCTNNPNSNSNKRCCSIVSLIFSWFLTIFSFIVLLVGGIANTSAAKYNTTIIDGDYYCEIPNYKWTFGVGAGASLIATILAIVFYVFSKDSTTYGTQNVQIPTTQYPTQYPSNQQGYY